MKNVSTKLKFGKISTVRQANQKTWNCFFASAF